MFNQETSSSTNYLIIACMLISFARFLFFQLNVQMNSKAKKRWNFFFDLLFTSVCVFIPKCGLFAGLNFEAIRVVLIDVLLLVYLIYVRPYRMDHYKSTVIILTLNSVANLPHLHESSHVQPFFACLFEKATVSECLSHCPLTSRSCLKRCSSQLLEAAQSELDALSRLENVLSFVLLTRVISRNCHTGGFALCAPVYPSTLKCLLKCHDNIILGPEVPDKNPSTVFTRT